MPTIRFQAEGTAEEKISAISAMVIQQQAYIKLLTTLVAELYASNGGHSQETVGALVDKLLPDHVALAAEDFRTFVLDHRINQIRSEDSSSGE